MPPRAGVLASGPPVLRAPGAHGSPHGAPDHRPRSTREGPGYTCAPTGGNQPERTMRQLPSFLRRKCEAGRVGLEPVEARSLRDREITEGIRRMHKADHGVHGARGIHVTLMREKCTVARRTVQRRSTEAREERQRCRAKRGCGVPRPRTRSAAISPISGANLAPCPEQGETTTTGPCRSRTKSPSGVEV